MSRIVTLKRSDGSHLSWTHESACEKMWPTQRACWFGRYGYCGVEKRCLGLELSIKSSAESARESALK